MVGRMSLSEPEWEELVAEWRRSGKSANRFAEEHGVPATALRYWINRPATRGVRSKVAIEKVAGARTSARSAQATTLARVVRPGEAVSVGRAPELRILVGKVTVVVDPGVDEGHLRAVVRALGEVE